MKRLGIGIGVIFLIAVGSTPWAFAQGQPPTVTSSVASFTIVSTKPQGTVWILNLWAFGNRVGTDSGTEGTLTVEVPPTHACKFQADVLRNGKWYSGTVVTLASCGGHVVPPTTTTTTTTTSTTPVTSSRGGGKSKGGKKRDRGGGHKAGTQPAPATTASKTDPTSATKSGTPVSSSQLAFTGTGAGLWTLGVTGGILVAAGAPLAFRRPKLRR
jgi:hypothetical protein